MVIKKLLKIEILKDCCRLYMFGKPHLRMIIASIICMILYTSFTGVQLALVKPVIDKLINGEINKTSVNNETVNDVKSFEDELPDNSESKKNSLDSLKSKIKLSIGSIGIVKSAKHYIDHVKNSFNCIGFMAMILAPFIFLTFYGQRYFSNRVIWGITRDIRNQVCEHLLPQPLKFFEDKKSGELISRTTNDVTATQGAVNILFGHVLLQPMKLFVGLGLSFYFNWHLTLISFIGLPLIILPVLFYGKKVKKHSKSSLKHLAELTDTMREMFSGIRIVKAYSMEKEEAKEIHDINHRFFKKRMKSTMARATSNGSTEFIYGLGLGVVIILGGYIITEHKISPGELGGFITAISFMVFRAIKQLSKSYNTLQDSLAGATRVFELLDQEVTIKDDKNAEELVRIEKGIKFEKVSFGYRSDTIIKNIDLDIDKGSIVGIVGQSGAGKSTLLNLILRFYLPTAGKIKIDDKDINFIKHRSLLDHIALVTQQTFLFNRSIRENIMYGSNHSNQNEIEEAAKAAHIHEFIETLPNGYDTTVGEMGLKLSGGQRQRIAIARAFLKDAPILILDEATSSLDSRSEKIVQATLNDLMKGKTTLVVAHRLTTIKNCNKIVVLKDGVIVETGTHDELMKMEGEYHMLYRMQSQTVHD